jgi:hypothetical protein
VNRPSVPWSMVALITAEKRASEVEFSRNAS